MFSKINNPSTNEKIKIKSRKGSEILLKYKKFILNKNDFYLLDGPISYFFFKIKEKKILLFGDYHDNVNRCFQIIKSKKKIPNYKKVEIKKNQKYITFINYLKKIIRDNIKKKQCIDFFMEDYYFSDSKKIIQKGGNQDDLIDQLRDYFESCQLKNLKKKNCKKNFRFHYWDVRKFDLYKNKNKHENFYKYHLLDEVSGNIEFDNPDLEFKNLEEIINTYLFLIGDNSNLEKYLNGENKIKKLQKFIFDPKKFEGNDIEEKYLQEKFELEINNNLLISEKRIIQKKKEFRNQYYLKLGSIKKIGQKIWKQMKNIDPNYCKKKDIINYWKFRFKLFFNSSKNIIDNKDVSKYNISKDEGGIWDLLMLSLTETYTIARMFRRFKNTRNIENCELHQSLKNIIYFAGYDHTKNIANFIIWKFKTKPILFKNARNFYGDSEQYDQCIKFPNYDFFNLN